MAHRGCHPESFDEAHGQLREGAFREILRCAQNDRSGGSSRKVYECHVFRFSLPANPSVCQCPIPVGTFTFSAPVIGSSPAITIGSVRTRNVKITLLITPSAAAR